MLQVVEEMMLPVMDLIEEFDKDRMARIVEKDIVINEALDGTRRYVAELSGQNGPQNGASNHRKEVRNLLEFAIAIEAAGDVVSKTLAQLAASRARDDIRFSAEGLAELRGMHDRVVANIALAGNVLVSGDVGIARRLLEEKGEFTHRQRKSRKSHLRRLAKGRVESLESSDLHLETGLALKEFNSHIAAIAYPILSREGQLLIPDWSPKTRLSYPRSHGRFQRWNDILLDCQRAMPFGLSTASTTAAEGDLPAAGRHPAVHTLVHPLATWLVHPLARWLVHPLD